MKPDLAAMTERILRSTCDDAVPWMQDGPLWRERALIAEAKLMQQGEKVIMEADKEEIFASLLFEKYEEYMMRLHVARKARYEAEVEQKNLEETIQLLKWRIQAQADHEARLSTTTGPSEEPQ